MTSGVQTNDLKSLRENRDGILPHSECFAEAGNQNNRAPFTGNLIVEPKSIRGLKKIILRCHENSSCFCKYFHFWAEKLCKFIIYTQLHFVKFIIIIKTIA